MVSKELKSMNPDAILDIGLMNPRLPAFSRASLRDLFPPILNQVTLLT